MLNHSVAKTQQLSYDERVKKFFLAFFITVIFLFSFYKNFLPKVNSQVRLGSYSIEITPQAASLGQRVDITTKINISSYPDSFYLNVSKTSGGATGIGETVSVVKFDLGKTTCKTTPFSGTDAIKSSSCNANTSPQEFYVSIDTNKIKADLNSNYDIQYKVYLSAITGGELSSSGFTILAPKPPSATFAIASISPDPAKPGDTITVNLSGTQNVEYQYGFLGQPFNKTICPDQACLLTLALPAQIATNWTATLAVKDSMGGLQQKTLNLLIPTVQPINPNQILITSVPTRAPTPIPPLSPCTEWVDQFGNVLSKESAAKTDLKRCTKVDTGLGIPLSTDPAGFVKSIFGIILSVSGGVALLLIIFSGYKLIMSQGNPEKAQEAKETLTAAIVGLLFIIFSLVILQVIGVDILRIPEFDR